MVYFKAFAFKFCGIKKEWEQAGKRITELDRIFKRIYVDDINSTITHKRFLKLPAEYEAEQSELTEFVQTEQAAVDTYERDKADFDSFISIIRKYVWIQELTSSVVNEFVKKIIVYAPDKSSGHHRQKIEIVWNFIGELEQNEDEQTIERQKKQGGIVFRLCRPAVIKLLLYECAYLNCSLLREIKNYLLYLLIKTWSTVRRRWFVHLH